VISAIKIVVLGVVGLIVTLPFFIDEKETPKGNIGGSEKDRLVSEKEALYSTIKELDFDHQMGKLSDDDYKQLKSEYTQKALSVLKALDHPDEKSSKGE
jgi:hypothetical protein